MYILLLGFILTLQTSQQDAFLNEVNQIRAAGCKCGDTYYQPAGAVTWNKVLEKTAELHSKDMQNKKYFSHFSKSGKSPADRLKAAGYKYRSFAENIFAAQGYEPSPKEVVAAWKNSPAHCKNLMNNTVTEMGVGSFKGYYTQLFGMQAN